MNNLISQIIADLTWQNILDILIATILIYYLILWLQGTRGLQLLRGLFVIFILYLVSRFAGLKTIDWLLTQFSTILMIFIVIVFQPELRRTLEKMGRGRFLRFLFPAKHSSELGFIRKITLAVDVLSQKRWGALIVIEKTQGAIGDYLETGTKLEANLTPELLVSIFNPLSPLHDGATIIHGETILGAHCLLPLTENPLIDKRLGTRHRAAIGISEQTDSLVITVSEQTGIISLVENGQIIGHLNKEMLEEKLLEIFSGTNKIKEKKENVGR